MESITSKRQSPVYLRTYVHKPFNLKNILYYGIFLARLEMFKTLAMQPKNRKHKREKELDHIKIMDYAWCHYLVYIFFLSKIIT
jgi:hypothetical protein